MNFKLLSREQLIKLIRLILAKMKPKKPKRGYEDFCLAMRMSESSNNYRIVNSLGYMGAYQFGMARLCDLGYTERIAGLTGFSNGSFKWKAGYSRKGFLGNPILQDKIFQEHVTRLLEYIDRNFNGYLSKEKNGVLVTRSGCVAFAHLAGMGGLRKFLTTGFDPKDIASGVPATTYMKKFANYQL